MRLARISFIFTHRIQYFTNLLAELHRRQEIAISACYAHETSRIDDPGFGRRIEWDNRRDEAWPEAVLQSSATRQHGPVLNSFSLELFQRLSELRPDIVHLNGYRAAIQWLGWTWAKAHGVPVILRGDGDTLGGGMRQGAARTLARRAFTRGAAHVFYQGEENKKFWLSRGASPARMSWIPCVSDGQVFRRKAFLTAYEREAFRSAQGASPSDVVFVVSGKLESRKRPGDAIEALSHPSLGNARLWFLGSGPLEPELRALARTSDVEARITWLGFRNQSEVPPVLQGADVLLHTSAWDPWPYSVLEGAISGLALLLSDRVGSHPDWVGAAGAGTVFRCGDIDDLVRAMRLMIDDRAARTSFQEAATKEAERYTETEFCRRFEEIAVGLCEPARGDRRP